MPITAPYISAKNALLHISPWDIPGMSQVMSRLNSLNMANIAQEYSKNIKAYLELELKFHLEEAAISALSGAVESGLKNSMLTPIIATIPVNPAAGINFAEQEALLLDAANSGKKLVDLIKTINNLP